MRLHALCFIPCTHVHVHIQQCIRLLYPTPPCLFSLSPPPPTLSLFPPPGPFPSPPPPCAGLSAMAWAASCFLRPSTSCWRRLFSLTSSAEREGGRERERERERERSKGGKEIKGRMEGWTIGENEGRREGDT